MTTEGVPGHGTTITGETFAAVAEITNVSIPGLEAEDIDMTTMDSTGGWREFLRGLKDAGELNFDIQYRKEDHDDWIEAMESDNEKWTVAFPDGGEFSCDGYVKNVPIENPMDDKITSSIVIKLSGKPEFTDES